MSREHFLAQYGDADHITAAQASKDDTTRALAAANPSITPEQLDKAVNDPEWLVNSMAAGNLNISRNQLIRISTHPFPWVQDAAKKHPRAKEFGLV